MPSNLNVEKDNKVVLRVFFYHAEAEDRRLGRIEHIFTYNDLYSKPYERIETGVKNGANVTIEYLDNLLLINSSHNVNVLLEDFTLAQAIHINTQGSVIINGASLNLPVGLFVNARKIQITTKLDANDFITLLATKDIETTQQIKTDKLRIHSKTLTYQNKIEANLGSITADLRSELSGSINLHGALATLNPKSEMLALNSKDLNALTKLTEDQINVMDLEPIITLACSNWRKVMHKQIFRKKQSVIVTDSYSIDGEIKITDGMLIFLKPVIIKSGSKIELNRSYLQTDKTSVEKDAKILGEDVTFKSFGQLFIAGICDINGLELLVKEFTVNGVLWGGKRLHLVGYQWATLNGVTGSENTVLHGRFLTGNVVDGEKIIYKSFISGGIIGVRHLYVKNIATALSAGNYFYGANFHKESGVNVDILSYARTYNYTNKSLINLGYTLKLPCVPGEWSDLMNPTKLLRAACLVCENVPALKGITNIASTAVDAASGLKYLAEKLYSMSQSDQTFVYQIMDGGYSFCATNVKAVNETIITLRSALQGQCTLDQLETLIDRLLHLQGYYILGNMIYCRATNLVKFAQDGLGNDTHAQMSKPSSSILGIDTNFIKEAVSLFGPSYFSTTFFSAEGGLNLSGSVFEYSIAQHQSGWTIAGIVHREALYSLSHSGRTNAWDIHEKAPYRTNSGVEVASHLHLDVGENNERGKTIAGSSNLKIQNLNIHSEAEFKSEQTQGIVTRNLNNEGKLELNNGSFKVEGRTTWKAGSKTNLKNLDYSAGIEFSQGGSANIENTKLSGSGKATFENGSNTHFKDSATEFDSIHRDDQSQQTYEGTFGAKAKNVSSAPKSSLVGAKNSTYFEQSDSADNQGNESHANLVRDTINMSAEEVADYVNGKNSHSNKHVEESIHLKTHTTETIVLDDYGRGEVGVEVASNGDIHQQQDYEGRSLSLSSARTVHMEAGASAEGPIHITSQERLDINNKRLESQSGEVKLLSEGPVNISNGTQLRSGKDDISVKGAQVTITSNLAPERTTVIGNKISLVASDDDLNLSNVKVQGQSSIYMESAGDTNWNAEYRDEWLSKHAMGRVSKGCVIEAGAGTAENNFTGVEVVSNKQFTNTASSVTSEGKINIFAQKGTFAKTDATVYKSKDDKKGHGLRKKYIVEHDAAFFRASFVSANEINFYMADGSVDFHGVNFFAPNGTNIIAREHINDASVAVDLNSKTTKVKFGIESKNPSTRSAEENSVFAHTTGITSFTSLESGMDFLGTIFIGAPGSKFDFSAPESIIFKQRKLENSQQTTTTSFEVNALGQNLLKPGDFSFDNLLKNFDPTGGSGRSLAQSNNAPEAFVNGVNTLYNLRGFLTAVAAGGVVQTLSQMTSVGVTYSQTRTKQSFQTEGLGGFYNGADIVIVTDKHVILGVNVFDNSNLLVRAKNFIIENNELFSKLDSRTFSLSGSINLTGSYDVGASAEFYSEERTTQTQHFLFINRLDLNVELLHIRGALVHANQATGRANTVITEDMLNHRRSTLRRVGASMQGNVDFAFNDEEEVSQGALGRLHVEEGFDSNNEESLHVLKHKNIGEKGITVGANAKNDLYEAGTEYEQVDQEIYKKSKGAGVSARIQANGAVKNTSVSINNSNRQAKVTEDGPQRTKEKTFVVKSVMPNKIIEDLSNTSNQAKYSNPIQDLNKKAAEQNSWFNNEPELPHSPYIEDGSKTLQFSAIPKATKQAPTNKNHSAASAKAPEQNSKKVDAAQDPMNLGNFLATPGYEYLTQDAVIGPNQIQQSSHSNHESKTAQDWKHNYGCELTQTNVLKLYYAGKLMPGDHSYVKNALETSISEAVKKGDESTFGYIRKAKDIIVNGYFQRGLDMQEKVRRAHGMEPDLTNMSYAAPILAKATLSLVPETPHEFALDAALAVIGGAGIERSLHMYKQYRIGRSLGANPFKYRTFEQIANRLEARGFIVKGNDPINGIGSYFHPISGRKYYFDYANTEKSIKGSFKELPHVDVHRIIDGKLIEHKLPKDCNLKTVKRKYPIGEKLIVKNNKLQ